MNLSSIRAAAIRGLSVRFGLCGWLRAQGLQVDEAIEGTLVYYCEVDSNELMALELLQGAIDRLSGTVEARLPPQHVASALSTVLGEIASGALPFDSGARTMLAAGTALYLVNSQPYRIAQSQKPPFVQFLVCAIPT